MDGAEHLKQRVTWVNQGEYGEGLEILANGVAGYERVSVDVDLFRMLREGAPSFTMSWLIKATLETVTGHVFQSEDTELIENPDGTMYLRLIHDDAVQSLPFTLQDIAAALL